VAWQRAARAPEPEIFQALLAGLLAGGSRSLFADDPGELSPARRTAIDALRFRWRTEEELVRLKSPTGSTGHYQGQYRGLAELGRGVIPILFDIVTDRSRPTPGEGATGRYDPVHPAMAHFERDELRVLAAYAFAEVVKRDDAETIGRLQSLWRSYWEDRSERRRWERQSLAPPLAFSLFDLGFEAPARIYVREVEREANDRDFDGLEKMWEAAFANIRIGQWADGQKFYNRILRSPANRALAAYNMACLFSTLARDRESGRRRNIETALDFLRRSIEEYNYSDWVWMEEDGDLDFIRKEPEYKRLLAALQKRYPARPRGKVPKRFEDFILPREREDGGK
jgi:hypothetical protein